jgi:tetratricopeptide (TPR) repeat protein
MNVFRNRWTLGICLVLVATTAALYGQVCTFEFINHDDPEYVSENPVVQRGFTWKGLQWAFTTIEMANWHPLTWMSHMLDTQLFGMNAGAHHLINVFFHLLNSALLFMILHRMTGALWRSAFVAALFALHPLHVESVAWISERKDVLSTFFGFMTIWAYARYADHPGWASYLCVFLFFALGLLAKPMLVTLPIILLLLDFWPLRRATLRQTNPSTPPAGAGPDHPKKKQRKRKPSDTKPPDAAPGIRWNTVLPLLTEKIPLLMLSAASGMITFYAQQKGGAIKSALEISVSDRVSNALVSYLLYLWKMLWPAGLSVFYPFQAWSPVLVWASAFIIVVSTIVAVKWADKRPYVVVGWLWYLVMLLPVIGLIKIGDSAMSDRYTYVSLIGPFVALTWGAVDISAAIPYRKGVLLALAGLILVACVALTAIQVSHWRNSVTLYSHALGVTERNYMAHNNLASAYIQENKLKEAMDHLDRAIEIKPTYAFAHHNIGAVLARMGRDDEAMEELETAVRLDPGLSRSYINMGNIHLSRGRADEAIASFEKSMRVASLQPQANAGIADALLLKRRDDEALIYYFRALEQQPDNAKLHYNAGILLAHKGRVDDAIDRFREAVRIAPGYAKAHNNLGSALLLKGRLEEAIGHFQEAVRIEPDYTMARENLKDALAQKTEVRKSGR